jgi:hypothetical protein
MADRVQTYPSHRRYIPEFHFFALPILGINVILTVIELFRAPGFTTMWLVLLSLALVIAAWTARAMALRAQDRIIRLEERLRLERVLPPDLRGRLGQLTTSQLIALRFAPDSEVVELVRRALDGDLKSRGDIKQAIREWRADELRV